MSVRPRCSCCLCCFVVVVIVVVAVVVVCVFVIVVCLCFVWFCFWCLFCLFVLLRCHCDIPAPRSHSAQQRSQKKTQERSQQRSPIKVVVIQAALVPPLGYYTEHLVINRRSELLEGVPVNVQVLGYEATQLTQAKLIKSVREHDLPQLQVKLSRCRLCRAVGTDHTGHVHTLANQMKIR